MLLHIQKLFTVVNALAQIVKLFSKRYQQAKKEKLLIDFSDYEHFCLQILTVQDEYGNFIPSLAAKAYQKKYKEILIDEYQDSNYIQETILSAVSKNSLGENNRFMVGDVKQSIYRFRLAMPEIFMEKYERYKVYENNKEKKIILSKNFRSRANVLAGVNFIFRQIMSKELGDILYDKDAELNWGLEFPESTENCGGENEILLLDTGDDLELEDSNYDYEEIEEMNRRELEALMIAKRIKTLMTSENFHVLDKETQKYRPVKFSDITILTRSVTSWAGVFEKIFKSEEIPFYAETARGYFETAEIMLVLNLLQIIDNPLQDIALIAVLYSPVCGFSANELMEIRLYSNEKTYYENIKLYLENMNEQKQSKEKNINIIKKLKEFLSKLDDWREKSITMSVSELLWYVYYDTGYFDYVGVTVGGNLRQGNLRVLIEKAQKYEETSRKGLFYFVRYIETVKDTNDLSSLAKLSNENENLIKIMTIHKSKGLEFPVVIVLDMGKKFNQEDTRAPLILHQKLGIGMNYLDLETRAKYQTLPRTALAEKIKEENLAEEIRVLYVAMTRAREKLILSGSIKNIERSVKNWISSSQTDIFTGFSLKKAKTYLDWLMPAFLRHETAKKFISEEFLEMEIENEFIKRAIKDDSLWSINIFKKSEFYEQKLDMKRRIEYGKDKFSLIDTKKDYSGHKNEIYEKLNFEYPYRQATKLPTKVSISEIKRRQLNISTSETQNTKLLIQPSIFEVPKFMLEKKELERAQIGTAVHMLMEELDFKKKYRVEEIKEEAMLMVSNGKLTEKEGQAISISSILAFFDTELSNRLQKSEYIKKEHSFAMTVSPMEIFPNENYDNVDELIVINGIIDCFFIEDGEIVLVDYKNDYIKNGEEDLLKKKYNLQLSFYKMALERGTGRKVKEVYIYSFMLKKAILMF